MKSKWVAVRLTEDQLKHIKAEATKSNLTISGFIQSIFAKQGLFVNKKQ